jgi:hypothetical protein
MIATYTHLSLLGILRAHGLLPKHDNSNDLFPFYAKIVRSEVLKAIGKTGGTKGGRKLVEAIRVDTTADQRRVHEYLARCWRGLRPISQRACCIASH